MDRAYIGVNFPNLVSVTIMVAVIVALYMGVKRFAPMKMGASNE